MSKLWNTMTDQIEHRRGYHTKNIEDIFYKITEKKSPNLKKKIHIQVKKAYWVPKRQTKKITSLHILEQRH